VEKYVEKWEISVENLWKSCGKPVEKWEIYVEKIPLCGKLTFFPQDFHTFSTISTPLYCLIILPSKNFSTVSTALNMMMKYIYISYHLLLNNRPLKQGFSLLQEKEHSWRRCGNRSAREGRRRYICFFPFGILKRRKFP